MMLLGYYLLRSNLGLLFLHNNHKMGWILSYALLKSIRAEIRLWTGLDEMLTGTTIPSRITMRRKTALLRSFDTCVLRLYSAAAAVSCCNLYHRY